MWAASRIRLYEELQSDASLPVEEEYAATVCRYDDLLDAIKSRRCVRRCLDKPVEDDVVDKIASVLDCGAHELQSPAGRGICRDTIRNVVRQCLSLYGGAACFTTIYAPLLLTFCADPRVYEMPAELVMPYLNVALGVQNCLLAALSGDLSDTSYVGSACWLGGSRAAAGFWESHRTFRSSSAPSAAIRMEVRTCPRGREKAYSSPDTRRQGPDSIVSPEEGLSNEGWNPDISQQLQLRCQSPDSIRPGDAKGCAVAAP